MPRCDAQIDEAHEMRRVVYVSWQAGNKLAREVHDKLLERLRITDYDDRGRELEIVANDPTEQIGEETAAARALRDRATDFVALFTTGYLASTKSLGRAGDPDLIFFVDRKSKVAAGEVTMWIFPVEAIELRRVSFKEAAIRSLAFPWWHGWRGDDDRIPLSDGSPRSEQDFDEEMRLRVGLILAHPTGCPTCPAHP